jgi:hypothetical protein
MLTARAHCDHLASDCRISLEGRSPPGALGRSSRRSGSKT